MKKLFSTTLMLIMALVMVGCGHKVVVVKETEIVVLTPPASLLKDCVVAVPPDKKKYVASNEQEKEEQLVEFGRAQTTNVGACNKDKRSIREWVTKETANQKKAEREKNATSK